MANDMMMMMMMMTMTMMMMMLMMMMMMMMMMMTNVSLGQRRRKLDSFSTSMCNEFGSPETKIQPNSHNMLVRKRFDLILKSTGMKLLRSKPMVH